MDPFQDVDEAVPSCEGGTYTIDIYLKSGAVVTVPNLESFSSKRDGTGFVEINWETIDYSHKLHSINPSDISAIVQKIK